MTKAINVTRQTRLTTAVLAIMFLFIATPQAAAQDGKCQVGARVQVQEINKAVGTITELGTEPPHVGWYRIAYEWNARSGNPKGDWYNPKNREIRIDGTDTKCAPAGAEDKPELQNKTTPGPISEGATPGGDECPMNEPPGKVTKTAPASAQLFKRVIYETMAFDGNSSRGPKKLGLTFVEFEMGKAFRNTLTNNRIGDRRLHDGAPVGAIIHPVKTKYMRCELYDTYIRGYVRQHNFVCFKDRRGDWVCEFDGGFKTLETKEIPLK